MKAIFFGFSYDVVYKDKRMKKKFVMILFCVMFQSSHSYGNVQVDNLLGFCSGVVFKMPGMKDNHKALVLTNGHCIGYGSYNRFFPDEKEIFIDFNIPIPQKIIVFSSDSESTFDYQKILFATTTDVDLAIIELEITYKRLKKKNYTVYSISREFPQVGMIMEFYTYSYHKTDICKVDKIVPILKEGVWSFNDSIRMKASEECRFISGQSGTAGIESHSGLVYTLAQTGYEGSTPCSFNNPCEIDREGTVSTGELDQSYAASVALLYDCYDEEQAVFDFDLESCPLKNGNEVRTGDWRYY